ncbi:hypothetical protein P3G55_00875 [Leptospira sp. 96542]|nr:hypothetical protein [Leptospira sp. 96542]
MKKLKYIGITLATLIFLGVIFYGYMGGFSRVIVNRTSLDPLEFYYHTHKGPYENISASWDSFQKDWESIGLKDCNSLAVYLDAPDTEPEKLRSILGCRMEGLSFEEKNKVFAKFKTFTIPKVDCLESEFPFKNFLSYFLAPNKVYPKFEEILITEKLETSVAIEVYGGSSQVAETIKFYMPFGVNRSVFKPLEDAFQ